MQILQFCLLNSKTQLRGRGRGVTPFHAIISNQFGEQWNLDDLEEYDENWYKKIEKKSGYEIDHTPSSLAIRGLRHKIGPSRKIFRMYLDDLIKEKLLIRITTSDKRKKYYSITPLGICHLIKSKLFFDGEKYPHPERNRVILILETFAESKANPYDSIIFENKKLFSHKIDLLKDIANWHISLRNQITDVFSNVSIHQDYLHTTFPTNYFEFFITNGYSSHNKIHLATFDFSDSPFTYVTELESIDLAQKELKLDDEQFHHYLAYLMLCSLIYDTALSDYDMDKPRFVKSKKKQRTQRMIDKDFNEDMKGLPEYFHHVLFLFSRHVLGITKNQYDLTNGFQEKLRKIQLIKK